MKYKLLHIPSGLVCRCDVKTNKDTIYIAIDNNRAYFSNDAYKKTITRKQWEKGRIKKELIVWMPDSNSVNFSQEDKHTIEEFELIPYK